MRHKGKTYWRRRLDKVLAERLVFEGRVLNVGCGWRRYGEDAVRLDINPHVRPDVLADIQAGMGLRDASFDTVLAFDVLEHLRDPWKALAEIGRVLKPGGLFYLTVPFCFPRHGVEYYRFSELALADMLEGFEVDVVPVLKSKFWNWVWNYFPDDTLVEGFFVKARKRPA